MSRYLVITLQALLLSLFLPGGFHQKREIKSYGVMIKGNSEKTGHRNTIRIFLCGDVMTGRGIDQVLPNPSDPLIYEPYMRSATGYVDLAENLHGHIPKPVSPAHIWGDSLVELQKFAPHIRIINLETSITRNNNYWPGKGIQYRMNPENIKILTTPKINYCSLANNHVLDWNYTGSLMMQVWILSMGTHPITLRGLKSTGTVQ